MPGEKIITQQLRNEEHIQPYCQYLSNHAERTMQCSVTLLVNYCAGLCHTLFGEMHMQFYRVNTVSEGNKTIEEKQIQCENTAHVT